MKKRFPFFLLLAVCIVLSGLFLTAPAEASDFTVTFPNGGEKLPIGSIQEITWEGYEEHELEIYLSTDSGKSYDTFIGSGSGGSFSWTVPDISTDQARIKVTGLIQYFTRYHEPYTVEDTSDADFSIGRLPAAPSDLTAVALSDSEIQLTWTDNADNETGFSIERNQHEVFTVGADVETATHASLPADTLYSYRVRAYNAFGYSDYSNTVRVSTLPEQPALLPPEAPTDLTAVALSDSEILLTWTNNADNETGFTFERTDDKTDYVFTYHLHEEDVETFTKTGLNAETTYTYRVRAFNEAGSSDYSNEASATTLPAGLVPPLPTVPEIIIKLHIDSTEYYVDDSPETMDTAPIIREGRTLLPIRYVAEPLGAEVGWEAAERKVTVNLEETVLELWIGQNRARVNGTYQFIDESNHDVMPLIVPPGRTMLPLRFIAESLGCQVEWDALTREVTVTYTRPEPQIVGELPELLEPQPDCSEHVIDFEDLDAEAQVFNQYGHMGVSFPFVPRIIEPGAVSTSSGTKALSTYRPGEEFGGKLVIEFTTGQTCVSMYVGLLDDTRGNKVLATLEAFDEQMVVIPGHGVIQDPGEKVAVQQRLIGPGPADIGTRMTVQTDEPQIYRVELSFEGGYSPVIDDLGFATIGEPFPISHATFQVTIETPKDGEYISGFETYSGAFDIMGTVQGEFKLEEVAISVRQGDQVREGLLSFSGEAPDYTFGGPNIHGLIFPGENQITVKAKSFSGYTGSHTIGVYYDPLPGGSEAELLILTPGDFYASLEPLRDWKNATGISSHIMTLDAIAQEWRFGLAGSRDLPERVKRAIAQAYNQHDTRYVMLVGDGDRFPVRYHKTGREGVSWGVVYAITDLYYACLFKPDGTFDNWDGNDNDIIGEWWAPAVDGGFAQNFDQINIDDCSLKPDVAVGRVPASHAWEVDAYVSKVIEYEMEGTSPWFNNIVLWNSDSDFRSDKEELDYVAGELLSAFTARKHYRPEGFESWDDSQKAQYEKERKEGIMAVIDQGASFAIFFGHGSRRSLGPLNAPSVSQLQNYGSYPVFIASACDTAKFVHERDIYMARFAPEWDPYVEGYGYYPPCWPHCEQEGWPDPRPEPAPIQPSSIDVDSMAEVLLFAPGKGGVGFLGSHMGTNHASHPFAKLFIGSWNYQHVGRLGDMWTTAVREFAEQYLEAEYMTKYGVDFGRCPFQSHHIHKFVLFGDPSLRMKD